MAKLAPNPPGTCAEAVRADEIRRILWIRFDHVGDALLTLPAIRTLKAKLGDSVEIDALVSPHVVPILDGQPEITKVYAWRRDGSGSDNLKTFIKLRRRRYDLTIDFRGDDVARLIAVAIGAKRRAGYRRTRFEEGATDLSILMTDAVMPVDESTVTYRYNQDLVQTLGLADREDAPYRYVVPSTVRGTAQSKLSRMGIRPPYAVVHPWTTKDYKNWRPDRFAAVIDHLASKRGLSVLVSGANADRRRNEEIIGLLTDKSRIANAAGEFSWTELASVLADADVMITVDTGPMHLAAVVGTPIVGLFVPWLADWFYPYRQPGAVLVPPGLERAACLNPSILVGDDPEQLHILDGITVDAVVDAVDRRLSEAKVDGPVHPADVMP